jgi:hypothetical protein
MNLNYLLNGNPDIRNLFGSGSPVTHYDDNGKLLSLEKYNSLLNEFDEVMKAEHRDIISNEKKTLIEKAFNSLGRSYEAFARGEVITGSYNLASSFLYTADSLMVSSLQFLASSFSKTSLYPAVKTIVSAFDIRSYEKINKSLHLKSPISHYDTNGDPEDIKDFLGKWQGMKLDLETYHINMHEYESSTYGKLVLNNLGKLATDLSKGKIISSAGDIALAIGHVAAGSLETMSEIVKGAYHLCSHAIPYNQSAEKKASPLEIEFSKNATEHKAIELNQIDLADFFMVTSADF